MLDRMRDDGMPGRVESAFRGFGTQCWVFAGWAHLARGGFCQAAEQSALPGHSQHQLGTTVDLFTAEWAARGPVFRDGFGCTPGGRWLDEHAWEFGFVVPYPIHPDDRKDGSRCLQRPGSPIPINPQTGYKHEPWHLRYIGEEAAARFHSAWLASDPGSPREITLEQWLRGARGLTGEAELPVCDGCQCGACATLASDGERTPCGRASLQLGPDGRVVAPAEGPRLLDARFVALAVLEAKISSPPHTPTQTPITDDRGPAYEADGSYLKLAPYPSTRPRSYVDLPGAWRLAAEPVPERIDGSAHTAPWPWRSSLASPKLAGTWNRVNVVLPASAGEARVRMKIELPPGTRAVRVALLRDGAEHDTREVAVPSAE
jgi:D-alanyl-D-alanine carboxypeptidase